MTKLLGIHTSEIEKSQLFTAWLAISFAFAILQVGFPGLFSGEILVAFAISALTVGIGFIAHELAHKIVAQRYGCFAEFRSDPSMLLFAVFSAFLGFIFAAPGAVVIMGRVDKEQNGKISIAGPAASLGIALVFLAVYLTTSGFFQLIASYGFFINTFIALFNLLPFGIFDGAKVFRWSKPVYFSFAIVVVIFLLLAYSI